MRFWILLLFILTSLCRAAILHVPADYPAIQPAMDASAPGDTVHVARGTWFGLYTSPLHSLTLCSDYLFTQDSTDINETILDGEYLGTILDLVCANEWFTLSGFTIQHGMGQQISNGSFCHRAGAIQLNPSVYAEIRDVVFRENRAPRSAAVLFQGTVCSVGGSIGDLILRNIACYANELDDLTSSITSVIRMNSQQSVLVVDGLHYDGGASTARPFVASGILMDSVYFNDVHIVNCLGSRFTYSGSFVREGGQVFTNLSSTDAQGPNSCTIELNAFNLEDVTSTVVVRDILMSGLRNSRPLSVTTGGAFLDIQNVAIENCRPGEGYNAVWLTSDSPGMLRNLHLDHNVSGDSVSVVGLPLLRTRNIGLDSVWVHDNRVILPGDPDVVNTGGNYVIGAMIYIESENLTVQNLYFENNSVEDLDDYSNHSPNAAYETNYGRELAVYAQHSLSASNIRVHHSRQPNHCPEVYSAPD
ncbi:MAG: hypothetical protein KDC10_13180, partial [Calditrichaeota bacterium]|nr:hypothetical protein [Calditrichota bacterium]